MDKNKGESFYLEQFLSVFLFFLGIFPFLSVYKRPTKNKVKKVK
jgi:hypothetical protein